MPRVNLQRNPSLRAGLLNYAPLNGSALSITSAYSFYGNDALLIAKSGDNSSGVQTTLPIPVEVGKPYAASAYVRLPNTIPNMEAAPLVIRVEWRNSLDTIIFTDTSATLELADDDNWYRVSGVWTAPIGATVAYIQVSQVVGGTPGAQFILDAILFEQSSYVGGYVDNLSQAEENRIVNTALTAAPEQIINGMRLNADVILNDLVLNTIDEYGVVWVCTDIDGWWGHSTPEIPDIARGVEDGSYDVEGRYQARTLTLNGVFFPPNEKALQAARDRLITASNLVRRGAWIRTNEEPTKAAFVRLSGRPMIATVNARGRTEFSIGLRAADPIKYGWDDSDPDGFSRAHVEASELFKEVVNLGTANVTGSFTLTGPLGSGSRIYNALTNETMTIIQSLRGRGSVGTVTKVSVTNRIATVQTINDHHLIVGDSVILSNVGTPFDSVAGPVTVTAATDEFPYLFSFDIASDDIDETNAGGNVQLALNDVLEIDTYNRQVTFNGDRIGHRSKLETLTDWIKLAPGINTLQLYDAVDRSRVISKSIVSGVATLTTDDVHYLIPGEQVTVALGETVSLAKKSLTANVVTLVTQSPHGFSVGDKIDVQSTEQSIVNAKSLTSNVASLTTVDTNGVSVSDTVIVNLPANALPVEKRLVSNVATLRTQQAHAFSVGDSVTVALPAAATPSAKAITNNQVTLTTAAAHNFQLGDSITVTLPTTATIVGKARSGPQVIITTSANHGFSTGDTIVMNLPATATPTASQSITAAPESLVSITTTAAHGFSPGDRVVVDTGIPSVATPATRSATTTACTIVFGVAHRWTVGEKITVTGMGARYDGTFYISTNTSTAVTYNFAGVADASATATGSVTNITQGSYYNGAKVVETTPTTTRFTYYAVGQDVATTNANVGTSPSIVNLTNTELNGTKTILSASGTQFTYNL